MSQPDKTTELKGRLEEEKNSVPKVIEAKERESGFVSILSKRIISVEER